MVIVQRRADTPAGRGEAAKRSGGIEASPRNTSSATVSAATTRSEDASSSSSRSSNSIGRVTAVALRKLEVEVGDRRGRGGSTSRRGSEDGGRRRDGGAVVVMMRTRSVRRRRRWHRHHLAPALVDGLERVVAVHDAVDGRGRGSGNAIP